MASTQPEFLALSLVLVGPLSGGVPADRAGPEVTEVIRCRGFSLVAADGSAIVRIGESADGSNRYGLSFLKRSSVGLTFQSTGTTSLTTPTEESSSPKALIVMDAVDPPGPDQAGMEGILTLVSNEGGEVASRITLSCGLAGPTIVLSRDGEAIATYPAVR